MAKTGKYIYGIVSRPCPSGEEPAEMGMGVHFIPYRGISAVVSDSEIVDYARLPKDAVARYLVRHQQIIEKVMESFTIIPMRMGTYAGDENEVKAILARAHAVVKGIFAEIHDKIEIDVAVTWGDFNSVLKDLGEEKEIKGFKAEVSAKPDGVTMEDQMKVGLMVKKALDKRRSRSAEDIRTALRAVCDDFRIHELMDDKMVANAAFLIDKTALDTFDKELEKLNAGFGGKLNFRRVGPLPPYSFFTLEVKKVDFRDVEQARRRFGLNNAATGEEVKKAHQINAFVTHPDKNPGVPGIEEKFDDIAKAHKTLVDYLEACRQAGNGSVYSFNEKEVKNNAILVKVKR